MGFCACFLMFEDAYALTGMPTKATKTKDGYAICTYKLNNRYDRNWILYTWAWYGPKGKPKSGLSVMYWTGSYSKSKEKEVNIINYDNKYNDNESWVNYFYENGKWSCPDGFYLIGELKDSGFLGLSKTESFSETPPWVSDIVMGTSDPYLNFPTFYQLKPRFGLNKVNGSKVVSKNGAIINENVDETGVVDQVNGNGNNITQENAEKHNETTAGDASVADLQAIKDYWNSHSGSNYGNASADCSIIDSNMQKLLNTIFTWISIIGIILVVVLSFIDGIKAVVGTDDGFRDFLKGLKNRIICLIVLLLAPTIVTFAIQTINGVGDIAGVNSDDPLCGVGK